MRYFIPSSTETHLAIVTIDSNKTILASNETFKTHFKAQEKETLPESRLSEAVEISFAENKSMSGLVIPEKMGKELAYFLVCSEIFDERGKLRQTIILFNITSIYQYWESKLVEGNLGTIGEMAAGVADIILNPLAVINGSLQMIEQKMKDLVILCPVTAQSVMSSLSLAKQEADHINNHIQRLLHLGKPVEMSLAPLLLSDVLGQILPDIQLETLKQHFFFECELPNNDVQLFIHLEYFKEVLQEIIRNSFEASPEGGKLKLSVEIMEDNVCFKILDFGQGIPKDIKKQARRPFFTTKENSIGLGLSFCDVIVNKMGGRMDIHDSEQGTEVDISLPLIR